MKNNRSSKTKASAKIPPPPGPEASYDEVIAYHSQYTLDELEKAGYTEEPSPKEVLEVTAAAEYWHLCQNGLHVQLTRKDYERLARLAARQEVASEELVKTWVKQRLAEETKRRTAHNVRL
jgi:hypothetical protein